MDSHSEVEAPPVISEQAPAKRNWLLIEMALAIGACIAVFWFFGAFNQGQNEKPSAFESVVKTAAQAATVENPLKASNVAFSSEEGARYITGTVRNTADHKFDYVQIQLNLLDASGTLIDSTLANANNLESGQSWKFKAYVSDPSATRFEIKDVSGF